MLKRQEFCANSIHQISKNSHTLKGTIFSQNIPNQAYCSKCSTLIEKQRINKVRQEMFLGGHKMAEFYKRQLIQVESDDDMKHQFNFYEKVLKIQKKVKKSFADTPQMITTEVINYNLNKLTDNIEHRKFDILTSLIEMGQIGKQVIQSSQSIQKFIQEKIEIQNNDIMKKFSEVDSLFPKTSIPVKFNHKDFIFNVSHHFYKNIKDIQQNIRKIKSKYSKHLGLQNEDYKDQSTYCNLSKEQNDKQIEKCKKNSEKQIYLISKQIKQLKSENKNLQDKVSEYESCFRLFIQSKLQEQKDELEKLKIELRIPKLIERFENKLKQQEKQIPLSQIEKFFQLIKPNQCHSSKP